MPNALLKRTNIFLLVFLLGLHLSAQGHVNNHPSIHDTVANIMTRFARTMTPEEINLSWMLRKCTRSFNTGRTEYSGDGILIIQCQCPCRYFHPE